MSVEKREPQFAAASEARPLASPELAALYIRQGEFDRGIQVYRELIARNPADTDLKLRLVDAEALANLLTMRGESSPHEYQRGYEAGFASALDRQEKLTRDERIARLNAWLDRVKKRYG
ncbi:MAG: tetratricopeptide repeat protein [Nitrospirota bacterium]|nr:tetratricopeptide repeat protein [Nitrospirota bacterium]